MRPSQSLALACAAIAIAGCSQSSTLQAAGPQVTDAEMPHPKPGVWEVTSATLGVRHDCLSGQTLRYFAPPAGCAQVSRQRSADGGVVIDSQCKQADGSSEHTLANAKGDYQRAFSVRFTVSGSAGPGLSDHLDYRFVGPCAPGQQPAD